MSYAQAMDEYGSDKPDIRFGMKLHELTAMAQHRDFSVFNGSEYIGPFA
jgi:aspartyl-tRNA synthetase